MAMYAYDFQTCGFAIVDNVRAIVESQREWDHSNSIRDAKANCSAAAKRFGIKRLVTDEQKALASFLVSKKAGLHISTYAWGTYAEIKAEGSVGLKPAAELATA